MKNIFISIFCIVLLSSCGSDETATNSGTETKKDSTQTEIVVANYNEELLVGQYMGEFGKSTMIIKLNYVKGKNASGYNIVRGNKRNIKGKISENGTTVHFDLDEPGDKDSDGKFEFDIDTLSFELTGKWIPNKPEYAKEKEFKLKRVDQVEPDANMLKDWYGTINEQYGTLILKKDGTCLFKGSHYSESNDSYTEFNVKGTWVEEGEKIKMELESSKYTKYTKLTLTKKNEGDEEYSSFILEDPDKASFYEYF